MSHRDASPKRRIRTDASLSARTEIEDTRILASERFGPKSRQKCDAMVDEKFALLGKLLAERFGIGPDDALVDNGSISMSFNQCTALIKCKMWSRKEVDVLSLPYQVTWTVCALAWLPAGLDVQFLAATVAVTPRTAFHSHVNWAADAELQLRRMDCFDGRWTHLFSLLEKERTAGLFTTARFGLVLLRLPALLDYAAYQEVLRLSGSWAHLAARETYAAVTAAAEKWTDEPILTNMPEQLAHAAHKHGLVISDPLDLILPYLLYAVPRKLFIEIDRVLAHASEKWRPTTEFIDQLSDRFDELCKSYYCLELDRCFGDSAQRLSSKSAFAVKCLA